MNCWLHRSKESHANWHSIALRHDKAIIAYGVDGSSSRWDDDRTEYARWGSGEPRGVAWSAYTVSTAMKAQHIGIPGTLRVVACCSGVWAVTVLARRMTTMLLLEVSLPMNRENERKMQPCHDMIKFTHILKSSTRVGQHTDRGSGAWRGWTVVVEVK